MGQVSDIIVTTPKDKMNVAAEEARRCIKARRGFYFRTFKVRPKLLQVGSRIFYVENGYVRGFGTVSKIVNGCMKCDTTGQDWGEGYHAIIPANSWKWIEPLPMRGFQGWRYFESKDIKITGNWLDPKPNP